MFLAGKFKFVAGKHHLDIAAAANWLTANQLPQFEHHKSIPTMFLGFPATSIIGAFTRKKVPKGLIWITNMFVMKMFSFREKNCVFQPKPFFRQPETNDVRIPLVAHRYEQIL